MRFRIPLWAEIAIAILVALAISNVATILFYQSQAEGRWHKFGDQLLADRIGETAITILAAPATKHADLLKAFSKRDERFTIDAAPLVAENAPRDKASEARIASHLGSQSKTDVRVVSLRNMVFFTRSLDGAGFGFAGRPIGPSETIGFVGERHEDGPRLTTSGDVLIGPGPGVPPPWPPSAGAVPAPAGGVGTFHYQPGMRVGGPPPRPPERMVVSIPIDPKHWLNARVAMPEPPTLPLVPLFSAAVAVTMLMIAAIWTARRVAIPLQRLSAAARAMRRGEPAPVVPETGPAAVRDATRSFNAMSQRLMATLESQRAMMVAIAHDLRTPIATLRLRAEFVEDAEAKAKLLETLGEMQAMTEAVLDAARSGQSGEQARAVDVSALAESLAADMSEVTGDVSFTGGAGVQCVCRTSEIRRALRNLIENAVRYGKRARVSVQSADDCAEIIVDDDGRGIPDEERERVFEPFARLERSRSKETGGYGLGLSIARLIARSHGGDVRLENRKEGGLRATISLPLNS